MTAETSVTVVTAIVPEVSVTPFDVATVTQIVADQTWWETLINLIKSVI